VKPTLTIEKPDTDETPLHYGHFQIPVKPNQWIEFSGYFPMSEESWARMLDILDKMKPGLVK